MAEWFKAHAWNACVRESVPWVRIPPCPPFHLTPIPLKASLNGSLAAMPTGSAVYKLSRVFPLPQAVMAMLLHRQGFPALFLLRFPLSCALQQEKSLLIYAA